MQERNELGGEKLDEEVMLPGFRFHPTDEELVGFYLRRKIQQRPLTIELIKHLDIYKYDPWDLPKLATTGEKEWYFYCPRDRKYRNSARPNRVTGAGFWKATGTDRPIYSSSSSEGSSSNNKCIGLKKSLVFYKGRAAKGVKTDWMMHEFRLPSLTDSLSPKKFMDKTSIPANESWAICRIFKKTNSTAQRALSHSWVSTLPEPNTSDILNKDQDKNTHFCSPNMPLTKKNFLPSQFCSTNTNNDTQHTTNSTISSHLYPLDVASYKSIINPLLHKAFDHNGDLSNNSLLFSSSSSSSPLETIISNNNNNNAKSTMDVSTMLLNMSSSSSSMLGDLSKSSEGSTTTNFGGLQDQCSGYNYPMQGTTIGNNYQYCDDGSLVKYFPNNNNVPRVDVQDDLETLRSVGFQFGMPIFNNNNIGDASWKSNLHWDACDVPSSYSTTKCYT